MGRSDGSGRRGQGAGSDRGVTAIVGVILLFGIVAVGTVLVVATGTVALDAVEQEAAEEQSVRTMDVVRGGVEDVQYGQRERFEDVWATDKLGTMTIEVNGQVNQTRPMGAFLHESEGGRYASQLGGTWTKTETGSRMVHEPQLEYATHTEGDTEIRKLSVPPIEVDEVEETTEGDDVIAGYRPVDEPIDEALIERLDDDEPLRNVTITIDDSPYAAAWARYLEEELPTHRADSEVQLRDGTVNATAPLGAESPTPDDAERADPPGAIEGPDRPFDARVTLAGADFGWSPQVGPFADAIDVFDTLPGEWESFDVDMPDAGFERVENPDGELEYFQTTSGMTSTEESREWTIEGETEDAELVDDPADETEIDVQAGETVTVTAADETTDLSVSDTGLEGLVRDDIASGRGRLEVTADETTTLDLGVTTDEEREYELQVETHQRYDELTFEATEYDEFRLEVTSESADFFVELRENGDVMESETFSGDASWTADAGETIDASYAVYRSDTSFDGGEATIRIGGLEGNESIDYEVTLEQTGVDSSVLDLGGDPPWFQRPPIETELQFRNATGTTAVQPWPETDVANVSDPPAAHPDDVNHPAVDYPLTYEAKNLEPGTTFAPTVAWRDGFCSSMNSYAGTWRTPDSGAYEDEILFEMGCSADDGGFDLLEELDVFDWFGDDESDDLNRELDPLGSADRGSASTGERVKVLEDGDRVPAIEPFEAQRNVTQLLGSDVVVYNESAGHHEVRLDPGEYVLLFELAPEGLLEPYDPTWEDALDSGTDGPDFNDMAMVYEITDVHDGGPSADSGRVHAGALDVADGVITAEDG